MTTPTATRRSVAHGIFTIERSYASVTPQRVFDAFATIEGKNGWFTAPNDRWEVVERTLDFRVGGRERLKGRWKNGLVTEFDATYFDIIPGERIVYTYEMRLDGRKISVSLATFEFKPSGTGARLVMTEQGAFLDGYDDNGSRERGSREIVDKLSAWLEG
ncbi:SRPBCC family protein [Variovorax saccharolyticus]|uniref:SRPBCC family protein n=1 Tax=Variovorax saccharolyticus TaxID=3053516 RepID=UPI002576EA03|nr:SRPBCC family protein [Variovorax sp. J22R187]MDM0018680.1 SRPBCC family protein [Variovorax sp. J22R187]